MDDLLEHLVHVMYNHMSQLGKTTSFIGCLYFCYRRFSRCYMEKNLFMKCIKNSTIIIYYTIILLY